MRILILVCLILIFIGFLPKEATDQQTSGPVLAGPAKMEVPGTDSLMRRLDHNMTCFYSQSLIDLLEKEKKFSLSDSTYNSLTIREKMLYSLSHPEKYSQICSMPVQAKDWNNNLNAHNPLFYDEFSLSQRQQEFLSDHRDSVMFYMEECIRQSDYITIRVKKVLFGLNAWEFIPLLIDKINNDKIFDTYNLTLLMLLMNQNEFAPFLTSDLHEKLYEGDATYREYIPLEESDKKFILGLADQLYQEKIKK